tara:strand:- start:431 stop:1039 length:609 start_codon:yes stop_codon:yes gene_type:complete
MSDTTNINQLPLVNDVTQNITLNTQDKEHVLQTPVNTTENLQHTQQPNMFSSDNQIDFVKNINKAAETGATQLPSRDIPRNTNNITIDPNVKVNYIEENKQPDYINLHNSEENIIANTNKRIQNDSLINKLFEEFQIVLIIIILFFLFQLPFFNSKLLSFIPKLFDDSGNLKFYGIVTKSLLFGFAFYIITKSSDNFLNKIS